MAFNSQHKEENWPWRAGEPDADYSISSHWPRLSIITPSFNQGQYIEETIRSVLLQGYPNLEYIIIDGGSTDNTLEIIKKYETHLSYWISEPDHGQSHAINKGLRRATGQIMAWLNADDLYYPGAFLQVADAAVQKNAKWIVGITIMGDYALHEIYRFKPSLYTAFGRDPFYTPSGWIDFVCTKKSGIALPQPSSFWWRELVIEAGGIDESLKYAMDHELYGRLARLGYRPILLDAPLAFFRLHAQQKTKDFPILFWKEELKVVRNWMDQTEGPDKIKLLKYSGWLDHKIKLHPYFAYLQNRKTNARNWVKNKIKPMLGWK
jgi:glycosyltransferase involved in cell wall biosynthesis